MAKDNPVGAVHELCSVAHLESVFEYEIMEGSDHSQRFRCTMKILGKVISTGEEYFSNKKEAQRAICMSVLNRMPILSVEGIPASRRGSDHSQCYQYEFNAENGKLHFESEWCKKKDEAKRQLLQQIIIHYLDLENQNSIISLNPSSPRFISNSQLAEDIEFNVNERMTSWQKDNLPVIKRTLMVNTNEWEDDHGLLDNYLTTAFLHPSFGHNEAIKAALQKFLKSDNVNYERFEFLGDALLGLVVSRELYDEFPSDAPGSLTNKKRPRVQNEACAENLRRLGLDKYIIHRDSLIPQSVKVLGDVFEAIIGGLYLIYEEEVFKLVRLYTKHDE